MDVCTGTLEFPVSVVCHGYAYDCAIPLEWTRIMVVSKVQTQTRALHVPQRIRVRPKTFHRAETFSYKIGPCGMATGMDIGLSNASLEFITLAFYSINLVTKD